MKKVVPEIGIIIIVQKPFAEQINGWFRCNGNTGLKWQRGCMFKVNSNLQILLTSYSQKVNENTTWQMIAYWFSNKNNVKLLLTGTDGNVNLYKELI